MAFQPVRLTHPTKGEEFADVVATTPVDLSNFRFRDGYVKSEDQSGLGDDTDTEHVDSSESAPEAPKAESPSVRRNRERQEREASKNADTPATDANGDTVQTA